MPITRRRFLAMTACVSAHSRALAETRGPARSFSPPQVGLQLYPINDLLSADLPGTLKAIRVIGFAGVELAGALHRSAREWRAVLDGEGLACRSIHLVGPEELERKFQFAREIGASSVVSALYMLRPSPSNSAYFQMINALTLDQYRRLADLCNQQAAVAAKSGLEFAYHNENFEFRPLEGGNGYEELLRHTDPALVKLELDCGWAFVAGAHLVEILKRHPGRYRMLHVKDFKPTSAPIFGLSPDDVPEPAELGHGQIDYAPVFRAAHAGGVRGYYVEQEAPFTRMPALRALQLDFQYTRDRLSESISNRSSETS